MTCHKKNNTPWWENSFSENIVTPKGLCGNFRGHWYFPRACAMVAGLLIFVFLSFLFFCHDSAFVTFCLHARYRDETQCQLTMCSL